MNKKQYHEHIENLGISPIEIEGVIQRLNPIFKQRAKQRQKSLNEW